MQALRDGTHRPPEFEISPAQIESYQRDGVVFLKRAFSDWVEPLRRGLNRNLSSPNDYRFPAESTRSGEPGRFFDSYCNWSLVPEYWDFVFHSKAASLAGQVMGSSTSQFFHEHVFVKEPGTQKATPWHQDMPYYCVTGAQSVSVYIALDDVEKDSAVKYVRGSHRWEQLYHPKVWLTGEDFNAEDGSMRSMPDILSEVDQKDVASWRLEAGDTVLFNFRTVHGTTDAVMKKGRCAFSARWMGDDISYIDRAGETSPPYVDLNLTTGDKMREDWFPVVWRANS